MDKNDMLSAPIMMSIDANELDCSKSGFWSYYDSVAPGVEFNSTYYEAVKVPLEIQMAKAGFRIAAWINSIATACDSNKNVQPKCDHTVCVVGAPLVSECSRCAALVIENDAYCGTQEWDWTCVDRVFSYCPNVECLSHLRISRDE
ncbi:hypothetical protein BC829DRAFT_31610 [Chytridium lagenaria]|nr:hypothetical protein BC829DRAFT_31610 [Chytridium lagenaria]